MKTVYPLVTFLSVALVAANPVPIKPGPVITNSGIEGLNIPSTNFARSEDIALAESNWVTKRAVALRDAISSLLTVRHDGGAAKTKDSKGKKKGAAAAAGANSNSTAAAAATNGTTTNTGKGKKSKGHDGAAGNATSAATNTTAAATNGTTTGKKHHKAAGAAAGGNDKGANANANANANGGNGGGAQKQNDAGLTNLIGDILNGNLRKREVRRSLNFWETEALRQAAGL